ncbi:response regulator transcription factor [Chloroflexota bacterium]
MGKTRILIADDDVSVLKYLGVCLRREGYDTIPANDGEQALLLAEAEDPTLVILDIKMPKVDGFEILRRLREWTQVPVIMLTTQGDEAAKVKCFDLGADDYVTKPFGPSELVARVKAVLKRTTLWEERPEPAFQSHDLVVDFAKHRVTLGGQDVALTATEFRLLSYLTRNAGRVITPDQILETVWGEEYVGEYPLLRVNVGRLRQKLRDGSREPKFIVTKIGIGYMFQKPA